MPDYTNDVRLLFEGGDNIPVDYAAPFTIKQTRGLDPYMFGVVFRDEAIDKFPGGGAADGQKCKFTFSTPDNSGGRSESEWELYLVRAEKSKVQEGAWNAIFADERWKADYKRHTVSYNIQWPDGSYRSDTLSSNGGRWRTVAAIEDFITKYVEAQVDVTRCQKLSTLMLPNNLGNSDYGGWVDATWSEILKPMLYSINCDLVIGWDRKWIIVPKTALQASGHSVASSGSGQGGGGEGIDKLRAMKRIVDNVDEPKIDWEKPKKLKVGFEIMAEAVIEGNPTATGSGGVIFDQPENVMVTLSPELQDPVAWWNDQISETADTEWAEIEPYLVTLGYAGSQGAAISMICKNWFLPNIVPLKRAGEFDEIKEDSSSPTANSIAYQKKLWVDAVLRRCWRRTYRAVFPTASGNLVSALRAMAGIRFGRLTPGGDTRSRGAVFCDWCEESTHALNFAHQSPFDSIFSDNHPFDPVRAAPFTARWIAQHGNELIFELVPPEPSRIGQAKVFPGLFAKKLTYGDWFHISADGYLNDTELFGEFDSTFDFRIYCAGSLVREDTRSGVSSPEGQIEGRHLVIERDLYQEGSIKSLDVRSNEVTANFGYTLAQMATPKGQLASRWPSALLNKPDLIALVDRAEEKIRAQFDQKAAGGISVAGVKPMVEKIITEGDIHEMSVIVGDPDPWSVKTQYIVLPAQSNIEIDPKDRDGKKPALIAQE